MPVEIGKKPDHAFHEPLGLLSDCHRRIERFLGVMLEVSRTKSPGPLSGPSRRAMEQALAYFRSAGPRHTADEEESLFPALRETPGPEAARLIANAEELERDHRDAESGHARVDELVSQWLERSLTEEEARELIAALENLRSTYETHIGFEDRELFPAAARVLSGAQLEKIGQQMAERRGLPYRGPIWRFFAADHERLDALLRAAAAEIEAGVASASFDAFRNGLLKHIAMEEKRLIPAATEARRGESPTIAQFLRADHSAFAAILVPSPTPASIAELRSLLTRHNQREEEAGGLYDECDRALGPADALRLVEELRAFPEVRLKPYRDDPMVERAIRDSLERSRNAWNDWSAERDE